MKHPGRILTDLEGNIIPTSGQESTDDSSSSVILVPGLMDDIAYLLKHEFETITDFYVDFVIDHVLDRIPKGFADDYSRTSGNAGKLGWYGHHVYTVNGVNGRINLSWTFTPTTENCKVVFMSKSGATKKYEVYDASLLRFEQIAGSDKNYVAFVAGKRKYDILSVDYSFSAS